MISPPPNMLRRLPLTGLTGCLHSAETDGGDLVTLSRVLWRRDVSTIANSYARHSAEEQSALHSRYSPVGQMFGAEAK